MNISFRSVTDFLGWINSQAAPVLDFLMGIKNDPIVVLLVPPVGFVCGWLFKRWKTTLSNRYKPEPKNNSIRLMPEKHRDKAKDHVVKGLESFQYSRRQDDFLGRQELIKRLTTEFLDIKGRYSEKRAFRWTLIYGQAGSGKSRFALELLRALEKKYGKRCAICGFVERDSSDTANAFSVAKIESWAYRKPAVFVLDYAGTNRELASIIKALQLKAKQIKKPLRLLLLERRNDSGGIADLNRVGDEDRYLRDTCFGLDNRDTSRIGIELEQLSEQDISRIMASRIIRERGSLGDSETPKWLLERLDDIYSGERRPLFAAMVASAIADQPAHQSGSDMGMVERLEKRDAMLSYLIRRDRRKYWQHAKGREGNLTLGLHQNLLALLTFARGGDLTIFNDSVNYPGARIPNVETFDASLYSRMTTSNVNSQCPLGFLEPDFIGEWFVLNQLNPSAAIDPDEPANKPDLECFVNLAWEKGKERAGQFIRQCHQNHPDTVQKLGYLLPESGTFTNFVVQLLRDLLLDWRLSISQILDSDEGQTAAEEIAERAQEVFELLQKHLGDTFSISDEVKVDLADATESYLYIHCWLLSPALRQRKDDRLEIIGEQNVTGKSRAPIHTSLKLQDIFRKESVFEQVGRAGQALPALSAVVEASDKTSQEIAEVETLLKRLGRIHEEERSMADKIEETDVEATKEGVFIYKLAAKLLTDAATFFRTLAAQNVEIRDQMEENATVFTQTSNLIEREPIGYVEDTRHCELAGRLLVDASGFFLALAEGNEHIREQMTENAKVYEQLGEMVKKDPLATLE